MKKITLILIVSLFVYLSLFAGPQKKVWRKRSDFTFLGIPQHIDFVNQEVGYFTAANKVFKTVDGGTNWDDIYTSNSIIYAFDILEEGDFWIGTDDGNIFEVEEDNYSSVLLYDDQMDRRVYGIDFMNPDSALAVGRFGLNIFTVNAGSDWESLLPISTFLRDINLYQPNNSDVAAIPIITGDITYFSFDWFSTWTHMAYQKTGGIHVFDENDILIGGADYLYYYGGINTENWFFPSYFDEYEYSRIMEFDFIDDHEGWFCTGIWLNRVGSGYIFHTVDGGNNWEVQQSDNEDHLWYYSIEMVNENKGFAGSILEDTTPPIGVLYEYTNSTPNSINTNNLNNIDRVKVSNYPNPFSNTTLIKFNNIDSDIRNTKIHIYNVAGKLVRTIQKMNDVDSSTLKVIWDGTNNSGIRIANGIYFCQLKTKNQSSNLHKMIYLK